ncbi:MAG: hypothetical protein AAFZ15_10890 [Bacteroidota bacterium]
MHQTKLVNLLKGLTQDEINRFSKFVRSPFYNTNPTVAKLFELLKSDHPDYTARRLKKENVFKKLYPGKPFHYQLMSNLRRQLVQLVREYLIVLENEQDELLKKKTLVRAFGKRNMYAFFEKGTEALIDDLEQNSFRDSIYYKEMLEAKYEYFYHPQTNRYRPNQDYAHDIMKMLDRYFVLFKLRMGSDLKTRERALSYSYQIDLLEPVKNIAGEKFYQENPIFSIYHKFYLLHEKRTDEQNFHELNNEYKTFVNQFRMTDKKLIFYELINYCVGKINLGKSDFNRDAFELFKFGLKNELLIVNGKMTEATYNNIVSTAGILDEFDWAFSFVEEYSVYLEEEIRRSAKMISLGELYFRQRQFDRVIETLWGEQFTHVIYQVKSRILLIMNWFEKYLEDQTNFEVVMSQVDAFEKYILRNKKISKNRKRGYLNFNAMVKKMVKNHFEILNSKKEKQKLLEKIHSYEVITGKVWLVRKLKSI